MAFRLREEEAWGMVRKFLKKVSDLVEFSFVLAIVVEFMLKNEETEEKFFDLVKVGCSFSLLNMKTTKRRGDLIAVEVKEDNMDSVHVRPSSPRLVQISVVQSSTIVSLISASCQRTSSS